MTRWLCFAVLGAAIAGAQPQLPATYIPQTKFDRGQDVVPSFDGWIHNSDGTFTLVFGYMNRNYQEELAIAPGPDNKLEPGDIDQGQPTYFLPRRHAWVFRVKVPADFGNKELVWTIVANGHAEKAYGHLLPSEEILERLIQTRGNLNPGLDDPNKPPVISVAPVQLGAGNSADLIAMVNDDGLPKPRVQKERAAPAKGQSNNSGPRQRAGLSVSWFEYRGPAKVTFDEPGPVSNGQSTTKAHFPQPGTYVLRATANDGALSTTADVTVTVSSPDPSPPARR